MRINFRPRPRAPDELGGVKIPYLHIRKGTGRKIAWYAIVFVVLTPVLYLGAGILHSWLTLTAQGRVALGEQHIRAADAGIITQVAVRPGEQVRQGSVLVVVDNFLLDAAAARSAVNSTRADAIRIQQAALNRAQLAQLRARETLLHYLRRRQLAVAQLVRDGAATEGELEAAATAVSNAEAATARAQADIAATQQSAAAPEIDRRLIQRQRDALTSRAPFDARVLQVPVSPGEFVTAGEPLITVARLSDPHIMAYVQPRIAARLSIGSIATVRFPDGARVQAVVSAMPQLAMRLPPAMVNQFGLRPATVVLELLPRSHWPRRDQVQNLPVSVRFHYGWESSGMGKLLGALVAHL